VGLIALCAVLGGSLLAGSYAKDTKEPEKPKKFPKAVAPGITRVGFIRVPELKECSGIAASAKQTGVLWAHTDGKVESLFALGMDGAHLRTFEVDKLKLEDWEDITRDEQGQLYLADIGNNDLKRKSLRIVQLDEPNVANGSSRVTPRKEWKIKFPAAPFNAEGLLIDQGKAYVFTKNPDKKPAEVYLVDLQLDAPLLERVASIAVPEPVTGVAFNENRTEVLVLSHDEAYLFAWPLKPENNPEKSRRLKLPKGKTEGVTWSPQGWLVANEEREIFRLEFPQGQ
jgi:hypothetical protein